MVLALVGARKAMDYVFTKRELQSLDDLMPEIVKKEIEERRNSVLPEALNEGDQVSLKRCVIVCKRSISSQRKQ